MPDRVTVARRLPPGLQPVSLRRLPRQLREDALQEAWLAQLAGGRPDRRLRAYARREERYRARYVPISQLDKGLQRALLELPDRG